jgi:hypothetical protein
VTKSALAIFLAPGLWGLLFNIAGLGTYNKAVRGGGGDSQGHVMMMMMMMPFLCSYRNKK